VEVAVSVAEGKLRAVETAEAAVVPAALRVFAFSSQPADNALV
jgi:hypothetical protein